MEQLFNQPNIGIFYMMLEEPVAWNDSIDKDQMMDYVFDHQRITRINQAMLDQYQAKAEDFIGATPRIFFQHDLAQGKEVWKQFFDQGYLHVETREQRWDGTPMIIEGNYICLYDDQGRITGHFGTQTDVKDQKKVEQEATQCKVELAEKDRLIQIILDHAPLAIWMSGDAPGSIFVNQYFRDNFDLSPEELALCQMSDQDAYQKNKTQNYTEAVTFQDGRQHTMAVIKARVDGEQTGYQGILGFGVDITDRVATEYALKASEEKSNLIETQMGDVVWVYNTSQRRYSYVSPSIREMLGYEVEEALQLRMDQVLTPLYYNMLAPRLTQNLKQFVRDPEGTVHQIYESQQIHKNGTVLWIEISASYRYNEQQEIELIGVSRSIESRKRKEEEALYYSLHDPQTGLQNKNALWKRFAEHKAGESGDKGSPIIFIDIDNFRVVNDTLGHAEGDRILNILARNIEEAVGERGIVYRYGGDEFVVVLCPDQKHITDQITQEILQAIAQHVGEKPKTFLLTASAGVFLGDDRISLEQSIKNADTALYLSKKKLNNITYFHPDLETTRTREAKLETDLRGALERDELELHYQPIVKVETGETNQVEALLRWKHPEYGWVSPAEFIPIAERSKLIIAVNEWVIRQACAQISKWKHTGLRDLYVGINLSLFHFENQGKKLERYLLDKVREFEIKPGDIKIEITESALLVDPAATLQMLQDLRSYGFRLALDDFGTGYSSFRHMKDLPVNMIKIDQSLIARIQQDPLEQMIARSLIDLIHGLGLKALAEGVESYEQLQLLEQFHCDYVQGFLFSKALTPSELEDYYVTQQSGRIIAVSSNEKKAPQ